MFSLCPISHSFKLNRLLAQTRLTEWSTPRNYAMKSSGSYLTYQYKYKHTSTAPIVSEQEFIPTRNDIPHITPTRRIRVKDDKSGLKLILYQYQTSVYCSKVRVFLDYYGISYDIVEVDPLLKQSIQWSNYKKLPIVLAKTPNGYQPLNDSNMIISALATYLKNEETSLVKVAQCFPVISYMDENGNTKSDVLNKYFIMLGEKNRAMNSEEVEEEVKWRKWADEVLVYTLYPNVFRTLPEAVQAFHWFFAVNEWDRQVPSWISNVIIYSGAPVLWMFNKVRRKYNFKGDVRNGLYKECNRYMQAIENKQTTFLGGSKPNLADLAVFGVLKSIEGCTAYEDLKRQPKLQDWLLAMQQAVDHHEGVASYLSGRQEEVNTQVIL